MTGAEKNLDSEIMSVARCYKKYDRLAQSYVISFHKISDSDKHNLAALVIENDDRDLDCIIQNEKDTAELIIKLLKTSDKDETFEFVGTLKKAITTYFEKRITQKLDDAMDELTYERKEQDYED